MRGVVPPSPPSFYLHGMAFNYAQDKLMLSNDLPSFESTMLVCRSMLVCHLFTVGARVGGGVWRDELVRGGRTDTSTTKSCLSYRTGKNTYE